MKGISAVMKEEETQDPSLSLCCEDTTRKWPSANQEEDSHRNPTMLAP